MTSTLNYSFCLFYNILSGKKLSVKNCEKLILKHIEDTYHNISKYNNNIYQVKR